MTLTDEDRIETARLDAMSIISTYSFTETLAYILNGESGEYLHPIATEILNGVSCARRLRIARAADGLNPKSIEKQDLLQFFNAIGGKLTNE